MRRRRPDRLLELLAYTAAANALRQRAGDPQLEREASECEAALAAISEAAAALPSERLVPEERERACDGQNPHADRGRGPRVCAAPGGAG
jgi:hypothetical protein